MRNIRKTITILLRRQDDLLRTTDTAYEDLDGKKYMAEKELLDLYRSFVSEMLKVSLAGIAVLGFLTNFIRNGDELCFVTKLYGSISMIIFSVGAVCALVFLYVSAEGYRYYIAGLRSKKRKDDDASNKCLEKRRAYIDICIISKATSAISSALGAIFAGGAIIYQLW